jgi:septum formation protein
MAIPTVAPLILASASPRRRELLRSVGVPFDVIPSDVPEDPLSGEQCDAFARRVARDKAVEVARRRPGAFVLGADTVVVVDGDLLGKPRDRADAHRMLTLLSGRAHRVLTAVALVDPAGEIDEILVETEVEMRPLSREEIEAYVDSSEPYDKAGAYAAQGGAARFVRDVRGSYSNVIGLPLDEVEALLRRHRMIVAPKGV